MTTPSDLYQQDIKQNLIQSDPDQEAAIVLLGAIHQKVIKQKSAPWYRRWMRQESPRGLYLWGGVGTGKTLVMDCFSRALPKGLAWRIHFHRFMQWVHERRQFHAGHRDPLRRVGEELAKNYRVLCLDEFTVTDITDAMILYGLLKAVFAEGMTLVTTSNIPIQDLYKDGLQRDRFLPAIALLEEHTQMQHVDSGNDYRMAFLQQASIYHTPLGKDADTQMEASFRHLAGAHEPSKSEIVIGGRTVSVLATGSGVVWFEFQVLCESNRSRSDYVELARRFHTLLLSNIPVLDNDQNDPARRFIELVDALYDSGVNLILSAAAEPDSLYTGKRLAEPFQRTISRLHEMSSKEYLARAHL